MMISDIVLERELPKEILESIDALVGCIGGASLRRDYLETIEKAGFSKIRVQGEKNYGAALSPDDPTVQRLAHERDIASQFNYNRAATIYGGSNEIQKNIIAKQILGLPMN